MAKRVCPWWLGRFLACPLFRWGQQPARILAPFVREGMTVLEPGPGMGFFTIELTRRVGNAGHVIAVDIQPKMIAGLERRLAREGLADRVETLLAQPASLNLPRDTGVDFTLLFAVVHEVADPPALFREIAQASVPGALVLFCEPKWHVNAVEFENELRIAERAGLVLRDRPEIAGSHAAVLRKA